MIANATLSGFLKTTVSSHSFIRYSIISTLSAFSQMKSPVTRESRYHFSRYLYEHWLPKHFSTIKKRQTKNQECERHQSCFSNSWLYELLHRLKTWSTLNKYNCKTKGFRWKNDVDKIFLKNGKESLKHSLLLRKLYGSVFHTHEKVNTWPTL